MRLEHGHLNRNRMEIYSGRFVILKVEALNPWVFTNVSCHIETILAFLNPITKCSWHCLEFGSQGKIYNPKTIFKIKS
jgi:hypothetical protein